jgi:hypothetical protein
MVNLMAISLKEKSHHQLPVDEVDSILPDGLDCSSVCLQKTNPKLNSRDWLDEQEGTVCESDLERWLARRPLRIGDEVDGFARRFFIENALTGG